MVGRVESIAAAFLALSIAPVGATCLEEAALFATRVCGELASRGRATLVTGTGELNAEAKGIISRILGSAGGEFKAGAELSTYEGLVREQLGARQN